MEVLDSQLVVFVLAVLSGILFRYLGMPSLIGQVTAGLLIGMSGFLGQKDVEVIKMMGNFGITLLLFLVGLEMNWMEIKKVAKSALGIFTGQTLLTMLFFVALMRLGLRQEMVTAVLLAVALSFSSTIVVVKILSEKKNLNSFPGKLSLGILLLQDMLAVVLLAVLPGFKNGVDWMMFGELILKIIGLFVLIEVIGHAFISILLREVIKNSEDLILFSLAWFFVSVMVAQKGFGLSIEVGSFLAGLSLSSTWGHFQITNKIKTLRDVFLTLFFVVLGLEVGVGKIDWATVALLSLAVITGKFIITYFWSLLCGTGRRVAFLVAIYMTQISEFGLVVVGMGMVSGLWGNETARVITVTGLVTMTISTVLIGLSERLYRMLHRKFGKISGVDREKGLKTADMKNHIVLLGGDRTGRSVINFLESAELPFLVVDFNPDVVNSIIKKGGKAIFADAGDPDLIDHTNMKEARLIISTIKDKEDSLTLLTELAYKKVDTPVIVDAESAEEAKELYEAGAAYVVFPHFVSGWHMGQIIMKSIKDDGVFDKYRRRQRVAMKKIYEGG